MAPTTEGAIVVRALRVSAKLIDEATGERRRFASARLHGRRSRAHAVGLGKRELPNAAASACQSLVNRVMAGAHKA